MRNPFTRNPSPPQALGKDKVLPEDEANFLSVWTFSWLNSFLAVGNSRVLEKDDLWTLPTRLLSSTIANDIETNFYARCSPEERPRSTRDRTPDIGNTATDAKPIKYDASLLRALHTTFKRRWWTAGLLQLLSNTLSTTTPLLTKVLLDYLTQSYLYHAEGESTGINKPRGIGYGIGLAFALFVMQEVASLMNNQSTMMAMSIGISIRTAIITATFHKSLRLSGRARLVHSVGQITTIISTDSTRLDIVSALGHNLWIAPIQIIIGIALLIKNLGYSALVGVAVLVLGFPIQMILGQIIFAQRLKGVGITDKRVRLGTEVLQGIRLIKYYAWESFYLAQIDKLRVKEIGTVRKTAMATSALIAIVTFTPVLATILTFITYSLTGHDLNIAIIFSSLQLFSIIRAPLFLFPIVLAASADAAVALGRVSTFLRADEIQDAYTIDYNLGRDKDLETTSDSEKEVEKSQPPVYGLVVDADFVWEAAPQNDPKFSVEEKEQKAKDKKAKATESLPVTAPEKTADDPAIETEKPFELKNFKMKVRQGEFVAMVGRIGSGKSSLLQGLIGEMRRTRGETKFGGNVAYVPQTAWIRNATLQENILFGREYDENKFREVIRACSLEHDLEVLPHGAHTEIGEKGINLSGGQKARVSLARAAYSDSDVILLDDTLSAVDAYVGKELLENCILNGPLAGKTRILVTHALHVLDKTDYIFVMDEGVIAEQGTYESLMKDSVIFSSVMGEYGGGERDASLNAPKLEAAAVIPVGPAEDTAGPALMSEEERSLGSVKWSVYGNFLRYAGGVIWGPFILLMLVMSEASQVGNNLFLGFWTSQSIPGFDNGKYMALYAGFGLAQATFSFMVSFSTALAALMASLRLFNAALSGVLRSPASFFDTTPVGRILSRLSKDQDTLDNELSIILSQFLNIFSSVIGTIALVFYTFPYLGIVFAPMAAVYYVISIYYRRTSVEIKRIDSLMRSFLYASYSETLTGLATIRAYSAQDRCSIDAELAMDLENRAYYMTIAIQRWLAVRLDLLSNLLVLGIGLFAAGFRNTISPSKIGVVLTYTLSTTQVFAEMVNMWAINEQNMNAVERVLYYAELPAEGELTTPNDPPASWPQKGDIYFDRASLAYREGLPLVLKGVTFHIGAGEKIGVVGRTGAGKSSLLQALFRMVELQDGSIEIDGVDISKIGLNVLRERLALVPQDSTLFPGTLRENIDPMGTRTDAELLSSLQKSWLLPRDGSHDAVAEAKFSLDSTVGDDGSNYSAGEKQLIALTRALVKNSRIIILDEATSSVDVATDSKLQRTIQTEFTGSSVISVAHRLNTIAYYDRVLVMDAGNIAEFDTVLNLFDQEASIFRSLCNEAGLSRSDIVRIREEHLGHP